MLEQMNHAGAVMAAQLLNSAAVTIAGVVAAFLYSRRKGCSAATRYGLWWLTLAFVIVAPFASLFVPEKPAAPANRTSVATVTFKRALTPIQPEGARLSVTAMLLIAWILAACIQAIRLLSSFIFSWNLKRTSQPAGDVLQRLFAQFQCGRSVELRVSHSVPSPAVVGYLRPQVLIPADLVARLEIGEIEQILRHELAHVARYDDWAIAIQRILEAMFVFHPLVRYLGHKLNQDRELACDDEVAANCDAKSYAACLAKIAEISAFIPARAVLVPLFERKADLLLRVEALLDKTRTHMPRISLRHLSVASAVLAIIAVCGFYSPRLMAVPLQQHASSDVDSIVVTSADGNSSMFGGWNGDHGEPGTIEFRFRGNVYVISDKSIAERASRILQPMQELGRKQSLLGEKQSQLGDEQSKLGEEQERMADRQLDAAAQAKLAAELKQLEARIAELNEKDLLKTAAEAQERLAELQERLGELQADMSSEQGRTGEQQGRLGEEQGKLGEKQAQLGKIQAELGAQQASEAKRVEQKLRDLIREAQAHGLAKQK
jgi:beta-lactamase regulating signal transducer with metallopeptidase domain